MQIQHEERARDGRFFVERDGGGSEGGGGPSAEMTYTRDGDVVTIRHTQVAPQLEGRGVGRQLVARAVDWARQSGLKIEPVCSFARALFDRTSEFADVRAAR